MVLDLLLVTTILPGMITRIIHFFTKWVSQRYQSQVNGLYSFANHFSFHLLWHLEEHCLVHSHISRTYLSSHSMSGWVKTFPALTFSIIHDNDAKYCSVWEHHLDRSCPRFHFESNAPWCEHCWSFVRLSFLQMETILLSIWKMSFSTSIS